MNDNITFKKIINRIAEIDHESKQINFLDSRFYERKNKYYPSITQILQCYPKGAHFEGWLRDVGWASEHIARKSAEEGTMVHELIEDYLEGKQLEWINPNGTAKYPKIVWQMLLRFVEFWETYKPTLIHSEIHLFSDKYEIAGTCDLVLEINKEIWLLDIKTSNHLNNSYDLQTAAYTICWNESFEEPIKRNGIIWLKSPKHKPDPKNLKMQGKGWEVKESERSIEENWEIFKHVHALYKIEHPNDKPLFNSFPTVIKKTF